MSAGFQAPYGGSGGLLGVLSGMLGGIHEANAQHEQAKETKAEDVQKQQLFNQQSQLNTQTMASNALTLKKTQGTMDQDVKTQAGADLTSLTNQMLKDPALGKDPAAIKKYQELSAASGQLPIMKNGNIDLDRLKPSFSDIAADPKKMTEIAQLPNSTRKSILDQFSGVPKSLYSDKPFVDAKTQNAIDKTRNLNNHYINVDAYTKHLDEAKSKYYDEQGKVIPAKIGELNARIGLDASRAAALTTTAGASVTRANAYAQTANTALMKFRASPTQGNMSLVRGLLSQSGSQLGQLRSELEKAQTLQAANRMNSVDDSQQQASDDAVKALQDAIDGPTGAVAQYQQLQQEISTNPQVSSFLSAGSGKPAENVQAKPIGNAPPGAVDGYYPNAKGGAVTIRGGQMYKGKG